MKTALFLALSLLSTACFSIEVLDEHNPSSDENAMRLIRRKYESYCDAGNPIGCAGLTTMRLHGHAGFSKDGEIALSQLKGFCSDQKIGYACHDLGLAYRDGYDAPLSPEEAVKYFEMGCTWKESRSCMAVAQMYERGEGTVQSDLKAQKYYAKGCGLGLDSACLQYFSRKQ